MLRRILCVFLVLWMPFAALGDYVMAGYDDKDTYRNWETNRFFQRMEERSGIRFTYRQYTDEAAWRTAKQAFQAGATDLPDILFKAQLTPAECMDLLDKGVLIDLAPYLETHCPNLYALLQAHPAWYQAISLPDGRIAALPAITDQPMQNAVWLNQNWLDALTLPMPTTREELEAVLTAFRDQDPNRNGRRDEIPLTFIGAFDLKFLGHIFGLTMNDYNLRMNGDAPEFVPLCAQFRPFVAWLRDLYSQGLLDKNGFSLNDSLRQVTDEKKANVYGGAITTLVTNFLPKGWIKSYRVMPPIAFEGKQQYRSFWGNVVGGTFAVTSACENVPEILRWVDSFYTPEVYTLAAIGQENVDFVFDGDDTWRMTDAASSNTYFSGEVLLATGASAPGMSYDALQRRFADDTMAYLSDQIGMINAVAARPFPYYALTYDQEAVLAPLQSRLGRIVDESIARWVLGEVPMDDDSFLSFEQQLKDAGLDEFMTFWQSAVSGGQLQ